MGFNEQSCVKRSTILMQCLVWTGLNALFFGLKYMFIDELYIYCQFLNQVQANQEFIHKKYQKWYTIDALGAIFAIFKY